MPALLLLAVFLDPVPPPGLEADIARLAHPRYAVREAAAKKLVAAGGGAKSLLRVTAATHADEEVRTRAGQLLESVVAAQAESLYPLPEIDAAWYCTDRKAYSLSACPRMVAILDSLGRDSRPWPNYYRATDLWVRERLLAGLRPEALRPILADMHRRDGVFINNRKAQDDPWDDLAPWAVDWEAYARAGK